MVLYIHVICDMHLDVSGNSGGYMEYVTYVQNQF